VLRERDYPAPPAPLDVDWMLFAACSELEVRESDRLFFCGQGQSRLANQARAICYGCEVQGECLEFALRNPEATEYGLWGATSPGQRRKLRGLSR
jgi:WhiB family redox-sensing transcriptional regulator